MKLKFILPAILAAISLQAVIAADAESLAVIPVPRKMERQEGAFKLTRETRIHVDAASRETGQYLAERLRKSTGYPFEISDRPADKGSISLTTNGVAAALGEEGYELVAAPDSVVIRAPAQAGVFYGVQSLLQLLPPEIFAGSLQTNLDWQIPCVRIEDEPRFKWRGYMLDVSRHFFNKDEVKRVLDTMALHKLNTFHWHLVDDHGWRIEIKKYPRLTEIGAWRAEIGSGLDKSTSTAFGAGDRYGGFYTQQEVRDIVAYAKSRHITVVPEIEMPGHSLAVLTAYPQYGCTGGPYEIPLKAGVYRGVYCSGKDEVFSFLEGVLTEVFELFPAKYIHIGGDEVNIENWKQCPKCQARMKAEGLKSEWELQSFFIRRMEKFINAKGRSLIGWSEIRAGGLAPNATVMDWIGGAVEAATNGHNVVMSPTRACYLDYYQSRDRSIEPRAIDGYLPLNRVYAFDPIPAELPAQFHHHILGAQGNLWTEYIAAMTHAEYMTYPRLTALAEVVWSPAASRDWRDFMNRLEVHYRRLDQLGVRYRHHPYNTPPVRTEQ